MMSPQADAMRAEAKADVVLMNSGGIASSLAPGPILLRDLYRVIPYQNRMVSFEVTGKVLLAYLNEILNVGGTFQVSGLSLHLARKPGERSLRALKILANGRPVAPERTYRVATSNFLLGRSASLTPKGDVQKGRLLRDILRDYLAAKSPVERPKRGRVLMEGE